MNYGVIGGRNQMVHRLLSGTDSRLLVCLDDGFVLEPRFFDVIAFGCSFRAALPVHYKIQAGRDTILDGSFIGDGFGRFF